MEHVELIKKFENYLLYGKQTSPNTVLAYVSDVRLFVAFCDTIKYSVLEMSSLLIENYLSKLHDEKKGTSINRNVSAIKCFYEYLTLTFNIANPMEKIEFHHHKAPLPKTLYIHDIMSLFDSFNDDEKDMFHKMIVYLLLGSGLRVSELTSLTFKNYYPNEGLFNIVGKGNTMRWVPLYDKAKVLLDQYIETTRKKWLQVEQKTLIINHKGKPLTRQYVYEMVRNQGIIANIKQSMTPHTLRHGFATMLLDQGADLRLVQELLGHKSISTTQIYTHLQPGKLHKSYDAFHPGSKISKESKKNE